MTSTPFIAGAVRAGTRAATGRSAKRRQTVRAQRGMTLVELLVGIAIGLMVVAVALAWNGPSG